MKAAVSLCAFSTPRPSRQDDWSLRGATLAVRLRRLLGLVAKTPGRAATQTSLDCSSFKVTDGQLMPCYFFFVWSDPLEGNNAHVNALNAFDRVGECVCECATRLCGLWQFICVEGVSGHLMPFHLHSRWPLSALNLSETSFKKQALLNASRPLIALKATSSDVGCMRERRLCMCGACCFNDSYATLYCCMALLSLPPPPHSSSFAIAYRFAARSVAVPVWPLLPSLPLCRRGLRVVRLRGGLFPTSLSFLALCAPPSLRVFVWLPLLPGLPPACPLSSRVFSLLPLLFGLPLLRFLWLSLSPPPPPFRLLVVGSPFLPSRFLPFFSPPCRAPPFLVPLPSFSFSPCLANTYALCYCYRYIAVCSKSVCVLVGLPGANPGPATNALHDETSVHMLCCIEMPCDDNFATSYHDDQSFARAAAATDNASLLIFSDLAISNLDATINNKRS